MKKYVISLIVYDHPGVLARISSLFCRKGFNIASITTSTTMEEDISRMTFSTFADESSIEQLVNQIKKLEEIKFTFLLEEKTSLFRELLLLKLSTSTEQITEIKEIAEVYGARILDLTFESIILELTGQESKIDGFLDIMRHYQIIEVCRTGITGMERGKNTQSKNSKDN